MATVRLSEESAPQFTPGPWTIRITQKSHDPSQHWRELMAGETVLAEIYGDGPEIGEVSSEEADANANAIAALPALYEALEECVRLMWADNPADGWGDAIAAARAALSSARGEQGK